MIYYIVVAILIIIIAFLIIFFSIKKNKNIETQPQYDLDLFYNNFNIDDYHILGSSNTNSTINIAYQDTAVKSAWEVARTIIQAKTLSGVFKATADPQTLMQLSGGGVGSAVIGDGKKIVAQAGFVKISPAEMASIIGPQVVFSILSIAVGQHFMAEISKKLSDISEKLDEILLHFKKEDIAVLESSKELIHEISKLNYTDGEHIDRLMRIEERLDIIYKYYKDELKNISISNLETNKLEFYGKLKEMDEKLEKKINDAQFYVKICFYSNELLNLIQLVKFNTYIKMQKIDINAINKANELFNKINNWKSDLFYNENINPYNKYIELIEEGKDKLKKIHDNAPIIKFVEDTILLKENEEYSIKKEKFEEKKNIGLNDYESMSYNQSRIMIENMNKPKEIILLNDNSGNLISLCKK